MDRIKRLSNEVLEKHKSKFGESFDDNKKTLDTVSIIRSKGLKNEIAGFITKLIKKEAREQKAKLAQIEAANAEKEEFEAQERQIVSEPSSEETQVSNTNTEEISAENIESPVTQEISESPKESPSEETQ